MTDVITEADAKEPSDKYIQAVRDKMSTDRSEHDEQYSEPYRVYLAGAVKEASDAHSWRDEITTFLEGAGSYENFEAVNPLDKYDGSEVDEDDLSDVDVHDFEIVDGDLEMIASCDAMLVNHAEPCETWGTPMEMVYATMFDIPVALAWESDTKVSPWAQVHSDYIAADLERAVDQLAGHFEVDYLPRPTFVSDKLYNPAGTDGKHVEIDADGVTTVHAESRSAVGIYSTDSDDTDVSDDTEVSDGTDVDEDLQWLSGDELAGRFAEDVGALVSSSRDTHGDAVENQEHIASGWTWYLRGQGFLDDDEELTGADVAAMMTQLKLSRSAVGEYAHDHLRDVAGYASIGAACNYKRGEGDDEFLIGGEHE